MTLEVFSSRFPHSDISGSMDICSSPKLFAAYHVFHRLLVPRHPPCALIGLTFLCRPMVLVASFSNKYKSLHSRLLLKITFLGCLVIKQLLSNRILILYAVFKVQYAAFCILSYLAAMEMERFELLTPCLQGRCSPN